MFSILNDDSMSGGRATLAEIRKMTSPYALAHAGIVRNGRSTRLEIRNSLHRLGEEFSREILGIRTKSSTVVTPLGEQASTLEFQGGLTAIVTTKGDYEAFGLSVGKMLEPNVVGFMNYDGRRAQEALNSPVREIELPAVGNRTVDCLVVAKSVLATGCTAISLTDTAMDLYRPSELIIASIFYSLNGVSEIRARFPAATLIVLGDPDVLDENGMLHPGVGLLEERI